MFNQCTHKKQNFTPARPHANQVRCGQFDDPKRLAAIIELVRPEETYLNVVTNGWGMSRKTIRWLKGLLVDKVTFSLDSGLESEHDAGHLP